MTNTPFYDEFSSPDVVWARDHLFEALTTLGVGPGTNERLGPEDDLVPYVPAQPNTGASDQPARPHVISMTETDTKLPVTAKPSVGNRMYVLGSDTGVVIDDTLLTLGTDAPPAKTTPPNKLKVDDPMKHLTEAQFLPMPDGKSAYLAKTFIALPSTGGNLNKFEMTKYDISEHPRELGESISPAPGIQSQGWTPMFLGASSSHSSQDEIYLYFTGNTTQILFVYNTNTSSWSNVSTSPTMYAGDKSAKPIGLMAAHGDDLYMIAHDDNDRHTSPARRILVCATGEGTKTDSPMHVFGDIAGPNVNELSAKAPGPGGIENPADLVVNSAYVFVSFPATKTVDVYARKEYKRGVSGRSEDIPVVPKSIVLGGKPFGKMAICDDALGVVHGDEVEGFSVSLYSKDQISSKMAVSQPPSVEVPAAQIEISDRPWAINFSADSRLLYVGYSSSVQSLSAVRHHISIYDINGLNAKNESAGRYVKTIDLPADLKDPHDLVLVHAPK